MRSMQPMRECPTLAVRKMHDQRVAALANSIQNETEGEARKDNSTPNPAQLPLVIALC
ncbi:hypothetical protein CDL15_Pgr000062 [Punica granatum]|uniref:Uncharacterized protein n=1 Tax=Punica granatum TaxID=22663 RepID=A0A218VPW0_PUNGR|nr:hypothetical protein CDL15_Pgr000062 [Punica granatum]